MRILHSLLTPHPHTLVDFSRMVVGVVWLMNWIVPPTPTLKPTLIVPLNVLSYRSPRQSKIEQKKLTCTHLCSALITIGNILILRFYMYLSFSLHYCMLIWSWLFIEIRLSCETNISSTLKITVILMLNEWLNARVIYYINTLF